MTLRNGDLDKTITVRDVLDALAEATHSASQTGYYSYVCDECGHEDDCYILTGEIETGIDEDLFEIALARRLDLG